MSTSMPVTRCAVHCHLTITPITQDPTQDLRQLNILTAHAHIAPTVHLRPVNARTWTLPRICPSRGQPRFQPRLRMWIIAGMTCASITMITSTTAAPRNVELLKQILGNPAGRHDFVYPVKIPEGSAISGAESFLTTQMSAVETEYLAPTNENDVPARHALRWRSSQGQDLWTMDGLLNFRRMRDIQWIRALLEPLIGREGVRCFGG